jgi:hypothetical protein
MLEDPDAFKARARLRSVYHEDVSKGRPVLPAALQTEQLVAHLLEWAALMPPFAVHLIGGQPSAPRWAGFWGDANLIVQCTLALFFPHWRVHQHQLCVCIVTTRRWTGFSSSHRQRELEAGKDGRSSAHQSTPWL